MWVRERRKEWEEKAMTTFFLASFWLLCSRNFRLFLFPVFVESSCVHESIFTHRLTLWTVFSLSPVLPPTPKTFIMSFTYFWACIFASSLSLTHVLFFNIFFSILEPSLSLWLSHTHKHTMIFVSFLGTNHFSRWLNFCNNNNKTTIRMNETQTSEHKHSIVHL